MPNKIEFTKPETKRIVKQYAKGESLESIAFEYGVAVSVIRRVLTEAGTEIRRVGRPAKA